MIFQSQFSRLDVLKLTVWNSSESQKSKKKIGKKYGFSGTLRVATSRSFVSKNKSKVWR